MAVRKGNVRDKVFISYAREDIAFCKRLRVHLKPQTRTGDVLVWVDKSMRPGDLWQEEIERALSQTKLAVLMISADFLASDFVVEHELPSLLRGAAEGEVTILPILVAPSDFEDSALSQFNTLFNNGPEDVLKKMSTARRDDVFVAAAKFIRQQMGESPDKGKRKKKAPKARAQPPGKKKAADGKRSIPETPSVAVERADISEFTASEWSKIRTELNATPDRHGFPQRSHGSVLFGSFNIRKFGRLKSELFPRGRSDLTMRFLADVCRQFDLLAVQEVMADLSGIHRLIELMGPQYGLVVSGLGSAFPGDSAWSDRLAFIYNRDVIERTATVWQVSATRDRLMRTLALEGQKIGAELAQQPPVRAFREYHSKTLPAFEAAIREGKRRKRPEEPPLHAELKTFVQFAHQPLAVGFRIRALPGLAPLDFMAINAKLFYGKIAVRRAELHALLEWVVFKFISGETRTVMLFGDLNFDYDRPQTDLKRLAVMLAGEKAKFGSDLLEDVGIGFPFVFPHPNSDRGQSPGEVFRTNVRLSSAFDQIGVISSDLRLVSTLATDQDGHASPETWGSRAEGPDYGVFNFSDLFSIALNEGTRLRDLRANQRRAFIRRYEFQVSDQMPVWLRLPRPTQEPGAAFPLS